MWLEVFIIDCNIKLLSSKFVFASQIIGLFNLELLNAAIFFVSDDRLDDVDATSSEPFIAPFKEIILFAKAFTSMSDVSIVQSSDEIWEFSVSPLMLVEISMKSSLNHIMAKHVEELLQERSALSIGYAIKDGFSFSSSVDFASDRVSC